MVKTFPKTQKDPQDIHQLTIREMISSKLDLRIKNSEISHASYSRFKANNYSFSNLLNQGYFDIKYCPYPLASSENRLDFLDKQLREYEIKARAAREPQYTKRNKLRKIQKKPPVIDYEKFLRPQNNALLTSTTLKNLGEIGVLINQQRPAIRIDEIRRLANVIVHLRYPFGHVFYVPDYDYFTITTTKDADSIKYVAGQIEQRQKIEEIYSLTGARGIELNSIYSNGGSIWDHRNLANKKSRENAFAAFREKILPTISPHVDLPNEYMRQERFTWVTNYATTLVNTYTVGVLFEHIAVRCWYYNSRPREKMLRRMIEFLLAVNSSFKQNLYHIKMKGNVKLTIHDFNHRVKLRGIKNYDTRSLYTTGKKRDKTFGKYEYGESLFVIKGVIQTQDVQQKHDKMLSKALTYANELILQNELIYWVKLSLPEWFLLNYILATYTNYNSGGLEWIFRGNVSIDGLYKNQGGHIFRMIAIVKRARIFKDFMKYVDISATRTTGKPHTETNIPNRLLRIIPTNRNDMDLMKHYTSMHVFKKVNNHFYIDPDFLQVRGILICPPPKIANSNEKITESFDAAFDRATSDLFRFMGNKTELTALVGPIHYWFILNVFLYMRTTFGHNPPTDVLEWKYSNPRYNVSNSKEILEKFYDHIFPTMAYIRERKYLDPNHVMRQYDQKFQFPDMIPEVLEIYKKEFKAIPLIFEHKQLGWITAKNFFIVHGKLTE